MRVFTTVPIDDPAEAPAVFAELERVGYTGAFSYETKHDPFLPLALGATSTTRLRLGTGIAVAFARSPMNLATVAHDLQALSRGRFTLGLGPQHESQLAQRWSMPGDKPAERMHELVRAVRAIWDAFDGHAPLDFDGEFYTHTSLPPACNPGPHEHGRAPIHLAGLSAETTRVAGEVADGLLVHPFHSRRSLAELTQPALEAGLAAADRRPDDVERLVAVLLATGEAGPDLDEAIAVVRRQVAFHAASSQYREVLAVHGWEDVGARLAELAETRRWDDMAELVDDDMLETVAVVGRRSEVGEMVRERVAGYADTVSIECPRRPDRHHFADIVAGLLIG